jgi:hypothetical protein
LYRVQLAFSIDFLDDGRVLEWMATADGADAVATERDDDTPRFYVAPRNPDADLDDEVTPVPDDVQRLPVEQGSVTVCHRVVPEVDIRRLDLVPTTFREQRDRHLLADRATSASPRVSTTVPGSTSSSIPSSPMSRPSRYR